MPVRTGGENRHDGLVNDGDSGIDLAFGDREGRSHAEAVEHATGRAHDIHGEAAPQAFIPDGDARRVGWRSGLAILNQLDADKQSLAAHIADLLVAFLQFPQAREQVLTPLACLLDQPLLLNHVDDGQPCRSRKRVGDVGGHVHEAFAVAVFLNLGRGEGSPKRDAAAQRFGNREDIRRHAEGLKAEHRAEATKAGLGLVEDQQHAALVAELAQTLEILRRGNNDATRRKHRFGDHGTQRADGLLVNQVETGIQAGAITAAVAMSNRAAIGIGGGQRERTRHGRPTISKRPVCILAMRNAISLASAPVFTRMTLFSEAGTRRTSRSASSSTGCESIQELRWMTVSRDCCTASTMRGWLCPFVEQIWPEVKSRIRCPSVVSSHAPEARATMNGANPGAERTKKRSRSSDMFLPFPV